MGLIGKSAQIDHIYINFPFVKSFMKFNKLLIHVYKPFYRYTIFIDGHKHFSRSLVQAIYCPIDFIAIYKSHLNSYSNI